MVFSQLYDVDHSLKDVNTSVNSFRLNYIKVDSTIVQHKLFTKGCIINEMVE